jgi:hypothetical protein
MAIDYDGEVVVEINTQEVDVVSFDDTVTTGRKVVKTMNRTGRAKGSVSGIETVEMSLTAPAPATGEYNWRTMKDAQIVIFPVGNTAKRTSYIDCNVISVGSKYQLEGEMVRDVKLYCLKKVDPA